MEITREEKVQVRFTVKDGDDRFTDALYFTTEERAALTDEQLQALQMARFEGYKAAVAARPVARARTEEEIASELKSLEEQRAILDATIATKSAELTTARTKTADPLVRSK